MMRTAISAIMPVYNVKNYLRRAIESIINQTFNNWQLILVDDGSTDGSSLICDEYASIYKQIHVIHQDNHGVSAARNAGLELAEGEYITFIDSDDYVESECFSRLYQKEYDMVIVGYWLEDYQSGKRTEKHISKYNLDLFCEKDAAEALFTQGYLNYCWGKSFRREIVLKNNIQFETDLKIGEDTAFNIDFVCHAKKIILKDLPSYHYVKYPHNTLSNRKISKELIADLEQCNNLLAIKILPLLGADCEKAVVMRLAKVYRNLFYILISSDAWKERGNIAFLFRQKWFRKVLEDGSTFSDESERFLTIIRMKSSLLLCLYIKYRSLKLRWKGIMEK